MTAWLWPSSETTDNVIPAFVAALQAVEDIAKSKRANLGTHSYSYADLDAVLDAVKPELTSKGLAVTQAASNDGVHSIVMHASGQWLSFPPLAVTTQQNTPQGQGSALTYARRYSMLALLGVATEDDDAQSASRPRSSRKAPAPQEQPPSEQRPAGLASDAQIKAIAAALSSQGVTAREDRHRYIVDVIGRPIETAKELTKPEASKVLDALKAAS